MPADRFNPDSLKKSAKRLKKALADGDAGARARFEAVFADRVGEPRLADCLHVVAREAGYESWPKLKADIDLRRAGRATLAAQLGASLYYGRLRHAERILALAPDIAEGSFPLQLALFDEARVFETLDAGPERLKALEKVNDESRLELDALTRVCSSHYVGIRPDLADAQRRIADRLLALGADPNATHPWPDDPDVKLPLLYTCLCVAGNLPLAEVLLDAGADPNDNECAYHACEMESLDGLRLLLRYGVKFEGTNALYRMLDFDKYEGAKLLLDNGADPNEHMAHGGSALRHAIRRGRDGRFADLLIACGADLAAPENRHSTYALAAIYGNASMLEALERHGAKTELTAEERFLAAVVSGRRREALETWAADKDIVSRLPEGDRKLHIAFAEQKGRLEALELMNAVGFDPNATDSGNMTPLHIAAWFGHAAHVRFYLTLDPDIGHINWYGATALGNVVHGSANCPERAHGDYVDCARLLVEAGWPIEPDKGHLAIGSEAVTAFLEARLLERAET